MAEDESGGFDRLAEDAIDIAPPVDPAPRPAIVEEIVGETATHIQNRDLVPAAFGTPEKSFLAEELFDFGYLDDAAEIDRYWLTPPYAYASILSDEDSRTTYYHVSEPTLTESEAYIRADLAPLVKEALAGTRFQTGTWEAFDTAVTEVVGEYQDTLPAGVLHKVAYYLMRDFRGYGAIEPLLRDPRIEDISGDGHDVPVFVYHDQYRDLPTNIVLTGREMDGIVRRLAQRAGEHISYAEPIVSATLPENHRVQLTLGTDIGPRGSNFTIRLFKAVPFTPVDLIRHNTFSVQQLAFLWFCIEHRKSILFVGPTASGKTTSLNAVSLFIDPHAKIVTIERTRELSLPHDNWVAGLTRQREGGTVRGGVGMDDLLNAALHQRPEYLIVGEIRTEPEVLRTFLQSVFTGHAGSTTFHAKDVPEVIKRFRADPFGLSDDLIATIDLVAVQRQVEIGDERERRCVRIAELDVDESEELVTTDIFLRDPDTDTHEPQFDNVSNVLDSINVANAWTDPDLKREIDRRIRLLTYLVDADFDDYRHIWAAIFAYNRDSEAVLAELEDGTFDPTTISLSHDR